MKLRVVCTYRTFAMQWHKLFTAFLLCVDLFCPSNTAIAQRPFNDDYYLFDTKREVRINALIQDNIGYEWLGTDIGIYRFNGQGDLYPVYETLHKRVTALCNANGYIYAGYEDGSIGKVVNDTLKLINILNAAPHAAIRDIYAAPSGILFLSTDKGLYTLINNLGFLTRTGNNSSEQSVSSVSLNGDGDIMIATASGLVKMVMTGSALSFQHYTEADGLPNNNIKVLKTVKATNYCWAGCARNGIVRIETNKENRGLKISGYGGKWQWGAINDILVLSKNHIWAATDMGYLLDVSLADSMQVKPYFFDGKEYSKLLYSSSGNMWCATAQGLSSLSIDFAEIIKVVPPYSLDDLTAIACDKQNNMWYAQGKNLYKTPLSADTVKPAPAGSVGSTITSLYADAQNDMWIGTASSGLWHRSNGSPIGNVSKATPFIGDSVYSLSGNSSGHLWVASSAGINELDIVGGNVKLIRNHNAGVGPNSDRVQQIYTDHLDKVWMACGSSVCMYDGRQYHKWNVTGNTDNSVIYNITEDATGNIWAGSSATGLYKYEAKGWRRYDKINGMQDLRIFTLMANSSGQVICVNAEGIDEWYPGSFQFRHFNTGTGPSIDSTTRAINCGAKDTAGNVYIPSVTGLVIFKNISTKVELKPLIHINKVGVYLRPVKYGTREFAYNQNHISFQYEGINFVNIEPLYYRYWLSGYSDEWTSSTNETISFPQLPPGKYSLRLQASLDKDFEEATEITYPFVINPPLWQRWWFILISLLLILLAIYVFIKLRDRRVGKMARLKQERMLFEYEHLKSQVNPHFLFNSLTTLTNLIEEDQENAIDYTVQLSALYRNILNYRNRDLILLEEECKLLSSYMHIQKRRFGDALALVSNIPKEQLEKYKIVPLALQLLVENAIKHNTVTLAKPLTIYISVTEDDYLIVRNSIQPRVSKEEGAGVALQNIEKRYGLLSKKEVSYGIVDQEYIVKLPLL